MDHNVIDNYVNRWSEILSKQKLDYMEIAEDYLKINNECEIKNIDHLCNAINNKNHAPFEMLLTQIHDRFHYHDISNEIGTESDIRKDYVKLNDDEVYMEIVFDFTHSLFFQFEANEIKFTESTLLPKINLDIIARGNSYKSNAKIDILIKRVFYNDEHEEYLLKGFPINKKDEYYSFIEETILKSISYSFLFRKLSKMYKDNNERLYKKHMNGIFTGLFANHDSAKSYARRNNDIALPLICSEYAEMHSMLSVINEMKIKSNE